MTLDFTQAGFVQAGFFQSITVPTPDIQQPYVPLWLVEIDQAET